jgi:hypothetical protein
LLQSEEKKWNCSGMVAMDKSDWVQDLLGEIRKSVKTRKYRITRHAQERQEQYNITLPELLFVLTNGFHEKDKTLFDTTFQTWKYAIFEGGLLIH